MSNKTTSPTPAVGQRWADNDKRSAGREIVIRNITGVVRPRAECDVYINKVASRSTVIRLDRFKPTATGYRYVGEGAP